MFVSIQKLVIYYINTPGVFLAVLPMKDIVLKYAELICCQCENIDINEDG